MKWVPMCSICREPESRAIPLRRARPCCYCGDLTWWRHPIATPKRGWFFWLNVGLSVLFGVGCAFLLTVVAASLFWAWKQ